MIRSMRAFFLSACALSLAACGGPSGPEGLEVGKSPQDGQVRIGHNFGPDARQIETQAGGILNAQSLEGLSHCAGNIDPRPNVRVRYTSNRGSFHIRSNARADTTLVVRTPSGEWLCNDDYLGLDPVVSADPAERGEYDVWVGSYRGGEADTTVEILPTRPASAAERSLGAFAQSANAFAEQAALQFETEVRPNARPSAGRVNFRAGRGDTLEESVTVSANVVMDAATGTLCPGYSQAAPHLVVRRRNGGNAPMAISARASFDTTLAVQTPDGEWHCNDDAWRLNPGLIFTDGERGEYKVWVGTLSRHESGPAEVFVTDGHFGPQTSGNASK